MLSEKNIEQKHRLLRKLKNNHPDKDFEHEFHELREYNMSRNDFRLISV